MNAGEREFSETLENRDHVDPLEDAVAEQGEQWLRAADQWVRRNPYLALGIAAAVGCALIALMRRDD